MFEKKRFDKNNVGTGADTLDSGTPCTMSNTEVFNKIEELMNPPRGEDIDTDKVEQYLALLQERAPVMKDYDPVAQWDKLTEDHPLLFDENGATETLAAKESIRSKCRQSGKFRIVKVVEVAAVAMLCLVITANAFGVNPIQSFVNWAEGIIQVYNNPSGIMELPANDPSEYHSLADALTANDIGKDGCPAWIPRDYSLFSVRVREADGIVKCTASYESTRGELIIRVSHYIMENATLTEECKDDGSLYDHNGVEYYIVTNNGWSKAGWNIGMNSYVISGQISEDELKEIIDSIA